MIIQVTPNNKSDLFCPQINSQCEVIISSIKTKIHGSTSRFVSTRFTFYSEHPKHTQQHIKQVKANANMIKGVLSARLRQKRAGNYTAR